MHIVRQGGSGYFGKEVGKWKGMRKGKEKQEQTVSLVTCQQRLTYINAAALGRLRPHNAGHIRNGLGPSVQGLSLPGR